MANEELNQLIKAARDAAFFIHSIDGYENSKIANDLSPLAEKVEKQKLLAIGRLAARVVYRNSKAAEQLRALDGGEVLPLHSHIFIDGHCACGRSIERHRQ